MVSETPRTYDQATQRLIDDLERKPASFFRDELLRAARRLRFHDYESTFAAPKIELIRRLSGARFDDLANKARNGDYDQDEQAAEEWARSPAGRRLLAEFRMK